METKEIASVMGGTIEEGRNPIPKPKGVLNPGRYKAMLTDISIDWGTDRTTGEEYSKLYYHFETEDGGQIRKMTYGGMGRKSKNYAWLNMLAENGIPATAMENEDKFWEYTKSLIGNIYSIVVKKNDDNEYVDIVNAMFEQKKAKSGGNGKTPEFDNDDLPF